MRQCTLPCIYFSFHAFDCSSIFDCITNAFFCIVAVEKAKQREANEAVGGAVIVVLLLAVCEAGDQTGTMCAAHLSAPCGLLTP